MSTLFPPGDLPAIWLFAPFMLAIIWCDLRLMRLPHPLIWVAMALFAGQVLGGLDLAPILWRIGISAIVFAVGFAAFAARIVGGGDVKVLAALTLLVPVQHLTLFVFLLGIGMLGGIVVLGVLRSRITDTKWAAFTRPNHFPVGLAIGFAGLALAALT